MVMMRTDICVLFILVAGPSLADTLTGQEVLDGLDVPQSDRQALESGEILTYDGEAYENNDRELSADAIVLVDRSLSEVVAQVRDVDSIIPIKYLTDHADIETVDDFAGVSYTVDEIKEVDQLLNARQGKDLNLSDDEIAMLQQVGIASRKLDDAGRAVAASNAIRKILIGRYQAYMERGLNGIPEYRRSKKKTVNIGDELKLTTETFEPFSPDFPAYYRAMRNFPDGADCCEHVFRWLKVKINKRPAFALSHTFFRKTDDMLIITERHFYVTHTINSVQVTVSWIPYDENTYMGLAVSASTDILESLIGRALKPLGRNKARDMVAEVLDDMRTEFQEGEAGAGVE
jgi:hypothetical protein